MEKEITKTYSFAVKDKNNVLLDLSREAAQIYNKSKNLAIEYYKENNKSLSAFDIQKQIYKDFSNANLHSDSKIASIQQYTKARNCYFAMLKEFKKNPKKFNDELPLPPTKDKEICAIFFKKSAIRYKKNKLLLSLNKKLEPLEFKWSKALPVPQFCSISYKKEKGWTVSCVLSSTCEAYDLSSNKTLGIDLGIKRIATCFDGKNTFMFSGKLIKSNIRIRNMQTAKTQTKLSSLTKHSKQYKKVNNANKEFNKKIRNRNNDIVKKYSRSIVNYCIKNDIGKIVIGKNDGTHKLRNKDKKTNQVRSEFPEQQLKNYVLYMFENAGGKAEVLPEYYTSQMCPKCGALNTPNNRHYKCKCCGFEFDRDGVGGINIWNLSEKVSFDEMLNVVGGLTPPRGIKYYPQLSNAFRY